MSQNRVPLVVLTRHQDNVESINSILRGSGQPAHCHWVREPGDLADILDNELPELLFFFVDDFDVSIAQVNDVCCHSAPPIPLIVVVDTADEEAITAALVAGARDLVNTSNKQRFNQVSAREIRAFRLERALNDTLSSATQYKKKLQAVMASAVDALAVVQEGILVDANDAWAEIFGSNSDDMLGQPVMDFFDANCHTVLKGALSACQKGRWEADPLRLQALHQDGRANGVEAWISASFHDGDPAIHVSIPVTPAQPAVAPSDDTPPPMESPEPAAEYYQRAHFLKLLEERVAGDGKSGVSVLAYLRPDRFGELKDEIGPLASEELLVQLASLIRGIDQPKDLLGRFGGTDFTMYLERGTLRDVEAWAENALAVINTHIFEVADHSVSLTCTMGIAEAASGTTDIDYLIRCAETALKRGRQRGGNEVVLEETSDEDTRTQRYDEIWVRHIKSALMDNRFRLLHLPIGSLSGESKVLFDTLVRMVDEQGNEVMPGEFMPAAARSKLMKNIDRWVVGASFSYCASGKPGTVFVRLSAESITDASLPEWLDQQLDQHRVSPDRLVFEVAETDATHHMKDTKTTAERLQAMGFGFAIEHFGLSRDPEQLLSHVTADYVKIDGMYIRSTGKRDHGILKGMAALCKELGVISVAEMIETKDQAERLRRLGINLGQGYFYGRPKSELAGL